MDLFYWLQSIFGFGRNLKDQIAETEQSIKTTKFKSSLDHLCLHLVIDPNDKATELAIADILRENNVSKYEAYGSLFELIDKKDPKKGLHTDLYSL